MPSTEFRFCKNMVPSWFGHLSFCIVCVPVVDEIVALRMVWRHENIQLMIAVMKLCHRGRRE